MDVIPNPSHHGQPLKATFRSDETSLFATNAIKTLRSSDEHSWSDIFAVQTHEAPHETYHQAVPYFWLSMGLQNAHVHRIIDGREEFTLLPAFSVSIATPDMPVECRIDDDIEAVHVFIKPELIKQVADEILPLGSENVSLKPIFGEQSASLSWLLRSIKQSLNEPAELSHLKIDYLARALCADLLSKYAEIGTETPSTGDITGLTTRQLGRLTDYIIEHLGSNMQVQELASIAGMGRTSFTQRFNASMHMTPYQYIMRLRVDKAKTLLQQSAFTLAEIAFVCGFSDQAHLASTFKRATGTTPATYRRSFL